MGIGTSQGSLADAGSDLEGLVGAGTGPEVLEEASASPESLKAADRSAEDPEGLAQVPRPSKGRRWPQGSRSCRLWRRKILKGWRRLRDPQRAGTGPKALEGLAPVTRLSKGRRRFRGAQRAGGAERFRGSADDRSPALVPASAKACPKHSMK